MAPDADAARSTGKRADPFAPLTSEQLAVGDGHEIYVETVGRADGLPAVYLHGGPGSGCQPDHRRLFDPERFHAVLFDQRGAGRSRPKGRRENNTLPHLIADMEMIRAKFGFAALDDRRRLVGRDAGAGLCAGASRSGHGHRVARDLSRHHAANSKARSSTRCRASIPVSARISSVCCPGGTRERRSMPTGAAFSISDPAVHGPVARAWHDTERILSEHTPSRTRLDLSSLKSSGPLPATPFMEAHYFQNELLHEAGQLLAEAGKLKGIPGLIVQGRYDLLCPPSTSHALAAVWAGFEGSFRRGRRPHAVRSRRQGRGDEGDRGSRLGNHGIKDRRKCRSPEKACC